MGVCKTLTVVVGLVAVLIGTVGKVYPEIFLNIPNIGFIPFMLMGGNNGILPPYFDISPWQGDNPSEWLRDGDVVVAVGPKAGTTWMCYCVDAIRRKGSDKVGLPFTDMMLTTPWIEMPHQPGQKWADRQSGYNSTVLPDGTKLKDYWDNAAFPFRVFKSHFLPRGSGDPISVLPVKERPNVKYVVAARNPIEVAKSVYAFFPKHTESFRNMWGGFPPIFPTPEAAIKELMPGGQIDSFYFGYVKAWWPFVKEPNVLALHYSDMVKDTSALVDKLAKFVDVTLSSGEKAKVVEKCGFKHMKENAHLFDYRLPLNLMGVGRVMQAGTHINKGKSGHSEDGVDKDVLKAFDDAVNRELTDSKFKQWAVNGGEL